MPMDTTLVRGLPVAPSHSPDRTRCANAATRSSTAGGGGGGGRGAGGRGWREGEGGGGGRLRRRGQQRRCACVENQRVCRVPLADHAPACTSSTALTPSIIILAPLGARSARCPTARSSVTLRCLPACMAAILPLTSAASASWPSSAMVCVVTRWRLKSSTTPSCSTTSDRQRSSSCGGVGRGAAGGARARRRRCVRARAVHARRARTRVWRRPPTERARVVTTADRT